MPQNHFTLLPVMLGHAIGHLLFLHYHLCFEQLKVVMAERQGFEPWIPCGIHAFQACAFSHSAISPRYAGLSESNIIGATQGAVARLENLQGVCAAIFCFTIADDSNSTATPCIR